VVDEGLRAELLRRAAVDQEARGAVGRGDLDHDDEQRAATRVGEVDADNTAWLRGVVDRHGWPGASLVGEDGANAAWLLVQHADHDPAFQRRCLDLLQAAVERGEGSARDLAYLTDRVLLAEGAEQEYGTQMRTTRAGYAPRSLRDPATVDVRRASVGLEPIAGYIAFMTEHHPPRPMSFPCSACGTPVEFWQPEDEDEWVWVTCPGCGATLGFGPLGTEPPDPPVSLGPSPGEDGR
jgi:hypothetical protein